MEQRGAKPLIFAGFAIPPRSVPNTTLVHNWTFASIGLARALGRDDEMRAVLDTAAAQQPASAVPIATARAVRFAAGDPEAFDLDAIVIERQEAFYAALGSRLVLLSGMSGEIRDRIFTVLLHQCLRLVPNGFDAGVFAILQHGAAPSDYIANTAKDYRQRLDRHADLRLSLAPMVDNLLSPPRSASIDGLAAAIQQVNADGLP